MEKPEFKSQFTDDKLKCNKDLNMKGKGINFQKTNEKNIFRIF